MTLTMASTLLARPAKTERITLAYALAGYTWEHFDIDISGVGPGISSIYRLGLQRL